MCANTPEEGNSALLLERVRLGRRPHLPCPSRWICVPRRIMAATSRMRRFVKESLLYAPVMHRSRARTARQWRAGGNQNDERRFFALSSQATIRLSDWRWMRTGRRHCFDETDHAPRRRRRGVCAAKKPDEFAVSIGCRLGAYQTLAFLLQRTTHRHLLCSRPRKILIVLYCSEYASSFSRPAVAHLPAPPSPRDERQCRTGSWFRRKRGAGLCRSARQDPTSLRGRVDLGGLLHRRLDLDVRPLNRWKNSRSRFFKQPLVVLID